MPREKLIKMLRKAVFLRNGNPQGNPNNAPRCGAKTRNGIPCRAPAMAIRRCRMHGRKSTDPRTPEGLERSRKVNWKHGYLSAESIFMRRYIHHVLHENGNLMENM